MTLFLAEVIAALEAAYPARLAEPWDTGIGLTCGDPGQRVSTVLLAVDVDPMTVAEAREIDADLLLTHHPLLFKPVQSVAASTDKGSLLRTLIRSNTAHFAAHTNADRAVGGVNDALADTLGLVDTSPLVPVVSGGGAMEGLGRVGTLREPTDLAAFTAEVALRLPATAWGVRAAGDPDRAVFTVAVCGGAGGSELAAATAAGVDVYVTSDLSHHVVAEHVADPQRPAVIDTAHWASEWPWLERAATVLEHACGPAVRTVVSTRRTDAWTIHAQHTGDAVDR